MTSTERQIRQHVYQATAERGRPPRATEVSAELGLSRHEVLEAFRALRARRLLLLAPDSGEIVMAPPFSAVPTPFQVTAGGHDYFANCVWDAYGIPAALGRDADVDTSCACCGEPMTLAVRDGRPLPTPGIAHFAVPAAHWWDDLPYT